MIKINTAWGAGHETRKNGSFAALSATTLAMAQRKTNGASTPTLVRATIVCRNSRTRRALERIIRRLLLFEKLRRRRLVRRSLWK
jgi:hypothetical protein